MQPTASSPSDARHSRFPVLASSVAALALIALSVWFGHEASGQDICTPSVLDLCYEENGDVMLATYTVASSESMNLHVTLSGRDPGLFEWDLEGDELTISFRSAMDYENPRDENRDNFYEVSIDLFDGVNQTSYPITVTVVDADEPGEVEFSAVQPQQGVPFTAEVVDPDGGISRVAWVWEKSARGSDEWTVIRVAASNVYQPVAADLNHHLRATAFYSDELGFAKKANAVSDRVVRERPETNHAPEFPTGEDGRRSVDEDSLPGTPVGDPVTAVDDEDGDLLVYKLGGDDSAEFDIDRSTGQLLVRSELDFGTRHQYQVTVTVTDPSLATAVLGITITVRNVAEIGTVTLSTQRPFVDRPIKAALNDPDSDVRRVSWRWASSRDGLTGWHLISGATSSAYTPTSDDIDQYLRATASYRDAEGSNKRSYAISRDPVDRFGDHAPEFESGETGVRRIRENLPVGSEVGEPLRVVDPEGNQTAFFLRDSSDRDLFELDSDTGQLRTAAVLNYEDRSRYELKISLHDSPGPDGDDTHRTVIVLVSNRIETESRLAQLNLAGLALAPEFSSDRYVYTAEASADLAAARVAAVPMLADASISVRVNGDPSDDSLALQGRGPFVVSVEVVAERPEYRSAYEIIVEKPESPRFVTELDGGTKQIRSDSRDRTIVFRPAGLTASDLSSELRQSANIYRRHTKERAERCEAEGFAANRRYDGESQITLVVAEDCVAGDYTIDVRVFKYETAPASEGLGFVTSKQRTVLVARGALDMTYIAPEPEPLHATRIEPEVRDVVLSVGDEVALNVLVYGAQGDAVDEGVDDLTFEWDDGDADGQFDGSGRKVGYIPPDEVGTYTVTATLDPEICIAEDAAACQAVFSITVRHPPEDEIEPPAIVGPIGAVPETIIDSEGLAYEVLSSLGGGFAVGDLTLDAPAGSIPNGEFIGIRIVASGPAADQADGGDRYTIAGDAFALDVVDRSGNRMSPYALKDAAEVCIPLPVGLRGSIDELSVATIGPRGFAVLSSQLRLRSGEDPRLCGALSELPARVFAASRRAPVELSASPTPVVEARLPETGGRPPIHPALLMIFSLACAACAAVMFLIEPKSHRDNGELEVTR